MGASQVNRFILVDTDVLIDVARQISEAVDCLTKLEHQFVVSVSVITYMELLLCQG